ncbi:MAG: DoxX family protein [Pseudomonadota bacterium]
MNDTISMVADLYDRAVRAVSHLDGLVSLLIRLILAPVMIGAGWEKITGDNWFSQEMMPFPFSVLPVELSWFLAGYTEFIGGICILFGLATRLWAVPLAITMLVAALSVHWDYGWPAISPSNPPAACVPDTEAHAESSVFYRYFKCYNVNERTIEASERLSRAKSILREHGNYRYLNGSGSIVKLNSGIEFAAIYFSMLLGLLMIGGGRYFSIDYYLRLLFRRG